MTSFRMHDVLIVSMGLESAQQIEDAIRESSRYQALTLQASELGKTAVKTAPDIIVADVQQVGDSELDVLNNIRAQFGDTPIVVMSEALDDEQVRRLFKAHIHDWLRKPLDAEALKKSLQSGIRSSKSVGNRVHAVISAVGGAGATTAAVSMADQLSTIAQKKKEGSVALFDLDFSTGDCSYVLNMVNPFNLESVTANPGRIDVEFINLIQQRHEHGFYVYSFKRPDIATAMNGYELVLRMLDAVSTQHEHTVLDIPYYEVEWKNEVLAAVNTCTVVTRMNLPAIKHTLDLIERIRELRGGSFPVSVVFNQHSGSLFGQRIKKSKLKELFGDTPLYYLPEDTATLEESVDRGITPSEVNSRSKFLKSLHKFMKNVDFAGASA